MTLTEIVEELRSCKYECEDGALEHDVTFLKLEQFAKRLAMSKGWTVVDAKLFDPERGAWPKEVEQFTATGDYYVDADQYAVKRNGRPWVYIEEGQYIVKCIMTAEEYKEATHGG